MTASGLSILLVEDQRPDAILLLALISQGRAPHKTRHVESVADALTALEDERFDVALLDLSLPDSAGMEGLHRLRAAHSALPVVVLTGLDDRRVADEAIAAGAQDYLVKGPRVPARMLERTLRHAIGRQLLIAELAKQRAAHAASEANFRALAAGADGLVILGGDGVVRYANPAALGLFGVSEPELVGHSLPFSLEPGDRREVGVGEDEAQRVVEIVVSATDWEGQPAALAALRDVSEQRALQARLRDGEKMKLVGRLAAGVAHDFNNLLTSLQGHLELARVLTDLTHPAASHVTAMAESMELATRLVRRLLAMGRRGAPAPRRVDTGQVLHDLSHILRRLLGRGVRLELTVAGDVPRVRIDPLQLEQVVINLAENARDAMEGRGRVDISLDPAAGEGGAAGVRLRVADTGPGIPAGIRPRLFTPFATTKKEGKGMGLGLAAVRDIVEGAGGTVEVASEPDKGATFTVWLPAARRTLPPTTPHALPGTVEDLGPRSILVADDEPVVRSLLRSALEAAGYRVSLAEDGLRAMELCRTGLVPDLLLTDVDMPGMRGPELALAMKDRLPQLEVIFMSGYTDDLREPDGTLRRDVTFLAKPFRMSELLSTIAARLAAAEPGD